jgi:hypothetical protein
MIPACEQNALNAAFEEGTLAVVSTRVDEPIEGMFRACLSSLIFD